MTKKRPESRIDYEALSQQAMRQIVRLALNYALRPEGLPDDHHFYIRFATNAPGVVIPDRLRDSFPEEMTIVLQHQYWDLKVEADYFEVDLSFNKVLERLHVPYSGITGFLDPSVNYGLNFDAPEVALPEILPMTRPTVEDGDSAASRPSDPQDDPPTKPSGSGASVVSLDKFRKK